VPNVTTMVGLAKGIYYYGASADDFILPGFFEKSLALLALHPSAGLCSTLCYSVDAEGENRRLLFAGPFGGRQINHYLRDAGLGR